MVAAVTRVKDWIGNRRWPPVGWIRWGDLRRLEPISRVFGFDRGLPIDRVYIEGFLHRHEADIQGTVLEVGDNTYTTRFGGQRVVESHVLHADEGNSKATFVADLSQGDGLPAAKFDTVILTQTLQFVFDIHSAVRTLHRILKPGGVLLATLPGISQISRYEMDRWGDYWRFTTVSSQRLFEEAFLRENIEVEGYGNVVAATAFLHGVAAEELTQNELWHRDDDYQLLITVRGRRQS